MRADEELQEKIQELQITEQNLQNLSMQKQAFQIELSETDSAIEETQKSADEIYRIVGQIMIRGKKAEILKELGEKKDFLALRMKSIEKQENFLREKSEKLREGLEEKSKKK